MRGHTALSTLPDKKTKIKLKNCKKDRKPQMLSTVDDKNQVLTIQFAFAV